jgi:hypothetical protein
MLIKISLRKGGQNDFLKKIGSVLKKAQSDTLSRRLLKSGVHIGKCQTAANEKRESFAGLPDGMFSNQISQFG